MSTPSKRVPINDMSDRQAEVLKLIVELYAQRAEPVGSMRLSEVLGYSPATIRADMAELERQNLISHPHTSAGRVPTDKGYRAYVNSLESRRADDRHGQVIARRVASAGDVEQAIKAAADALSQTTSNVGLATLGGNLYLTGFSSLFGQPEFLGSRRAFEVARLVDSLEEWLTEAAPQESLSVWIGQENPVGKASGCSLVVARFASPYSDRSYVGILGPTRQSYSKVISLVDYAGRLLEEVAHA